MSVTIDMRYRYGFHSLDVGKVWLRHYTDVREASKADTRIKNATGKYGRKHQRRFRVQRKGLMVLVVRVQ